MNAGSTTVRALVVLAVAVSLSGGAMVGDVTAGPAALPGSGVPAANVATLPIPPGPPQMLVPVEAPRQAQGDKPMWRSEPTHLSIPSIGVETSLMALGVIADGSMEVPPGAYPAGWYTGAPTPGELGTALLAGHVDWAGPAVFHDLAALETGDVITVTRDDASTATFAVTRVERHAKSALPKDVLFGQVASARLVLVTCGGEIDPATGHYIDNTLVFAEMVDSTSP